MSFRVTPGPHLRAMQMGRQHGQQNRLLQQQKQIGEALQSGDYGQGAQAAFGQGNIETGLALQQTQQQAQQRRQELARKRQEQVRERVGRLAKYASGIQDPDQRRQYAEQIFDVHPRFRAVLDQYGVDVSDPDRALGFLLAESGIDQPEPTAAMREFRYAQRNPAFADYQERTSQPAVVMKGETAYRKERGSQLAKDYGRIQEDARKARSRIGQLRQIDSLLSNPDVYTGTGAEAVNTLKRMGQTLFGMDFKGVADAEAARRVVDEMALSMTDQLPGPISNQELALLRSIPPNIGDTAEGRKLLVELTKAKEQRKIELARLARDYVRENGRLDDGWFDVAARYAEQNPMFDEETMERARKVASTAQQTSPYAGTYPRVETADDWEALEPGEYYFDPNGRPRQKQAR